ncbi:MAG: hypothetical protein HDR37_08610 [Treponema sp.]|nr:hypothetical protein [Treponema sp.]
MKKFFLGTLTFFCFGIFAFAQGIPNYDGKGADVAMLVDIKANKGVKDNIVLVNLANPDGMIFNIYVYEGNVWRNFGSGALKYLHDKNNISSRLEKDFGEYKYAAIVPLDGKKYSYETRVKNDDLYFYVLPENPSYSAFANNATEIDVSSFQKKLKDNIRLVSNSAGISDTGFFIFADNGNGFKLIAAAHLKGALELSLEYINYSNIEISQIAKYTKGDECFAEGFDLNLKAKKYFRYAVSASDGKKYNYVAQARNSDLYIYVED